MVKPIERPIECSITRQSGSKRAATLEQQRAARSERLMKQARAWLQDLADEMHSECEVARRDVHNPGDYLIGACTLTKWCHVVDDVLRIIIITTS